MSSKKMEWKNLLLGILSLIRILLIFHFDTKFRIGIMVGLLSAFLAAIFSIINKNWEIGIKFRYQGGTPYTPYDMNLSKISFATLGSGVLDYTRLNSERNKAYHSSDLRLDKKYNYKKTTLDFYIDITNWYGAKSVAPPFYVFSANPNGSFKTTDGKPLQKDGSNAIPELFDNNSIFITPTIGFIWEF